MKIAITRAVSPRLGECELSFIDRQPIDVSRATSQHEDYERRLAAHGCAVTRVADAPEMPDGVFVEDAAVVLEEVAVIASPGALSRRGEIVAVAEAVQPYRSLRHIEPPATLDGGDVLCHRRKLYVGRSRRTNDDGILQLRMILADFGYGVIPVEFDHCLHLKSAVTQIDASTLLVNRAWVDPKQFRNFQVIDVQEPYAANALRIGDTLLHGAAYARTRRLLESRGYKVEPIEISELEKAEAGVTCCSVIFEA